MKTKLRVCGALFDGDEEYEKENYDSLIFMECSRERAREIKSETNHMEYLRRQEKETG